MDVSVIVASYNPKWDKLKRTVISILKQKDIDIEIIVTDDGSKENCFDKLEGLFEEYKFSNYKLVGATKNQGTCRNLKKGITVATGKYVKLISPGDYMYAANTLKAWCDYADSEGSRLCFGDAVYYSTSDNGIKVHSVKSTPQNTDIYNKCNYSMKSAILNYLFLKDAVVGSCLIADRALMAQYIDIMTGIIKYSEDMSYLIMLVDGIRLDYYPKPTVWYEYGVGISTSGNDKWLGIIEDERYATHKYIISNNPLNGISWVRLNACLKVTSNPKWNALKYLIYPELIYWKIKKNRCNEYTKSADIAKLIEITE